MVLNLRTLLIIFLILVPFNSGMVEGFKDSSMKLPDHSLYKNDIQMKMRKLLMVEVQDYDDAGPNCKHDPKKKPCRP